MLENNHVDSNRDCFPPPSFPFTPTVSHCEISMTLGSCRTGWAHACLMQASYDKESPLYREARQVPRNRRQTPRTDPGTLRCPPPGRSERDGAAQFRTLGEQRAARRGLSLLSLCFPYIRQNVFFPKLTGPQRF